MTELKTEIANIVSRTDLAPMLRATMIIDVAESYGFVDSTKEPLATLLKLYEQTAETCPKCKGSGLFNSWDENMSRLMAGGVTCPTCSGTGKVHNLERLVILGE